MATFNLEKGNKFNLDKGVRKVLIGLGWEAGANHDLDVSILGLVHITGSPRFYGDGSHAVCFANESLKQKDNTFVTSDGSIKHYGDSRTGKESGDDEKIEVDFSKIPAEIVELAIFATIYKAKLRGQCFGSVKESYIHVTDLDTNQDLCIYKLRDEFAGSTAVQVGSFLREGNNWVFKAVGAGSTVELGDILEQYQ